MASPARSASTSRGSIKSWRSTAPAAPRASRAASSAWPGGRLKPHGLTLRHFPQSFEFSTLGRLDRDPLGRPFRDALHPHRRLRRKPTRGDPCGRAREPAPARIRRRAEPGSPDDRLRGRARRDHRGLDAPPGPAEVPGRRGRRLRPPHGRRRAVRAVAQAGLYPSTCAWSTPRNSPQTAWATAASRSSCSPSNPPTTRSTPGRRARSSWCRTTAAGRSPMRAPPRHGAPRHPMPYQREVLVPRDMIVDTFETAITWDRFEAFHAGQVGDRAGDPRSHWDRRPGPVGSPTSTPTARRPISRSMPQVAAARARAVAADQGPGVGCGDRRRRHDHHHHAVGRDHMPWYQRQRPALFGAALAAAKRTLDPAGILNPGVLITASDDRGRWRRSRRDRTKLDPPQSIANPKN